MMRSLKVRWDAELTVVFGKIKIDLADLERRLEERYPEEMETMSMQEVIEKYYGHEAVQFILDYL